MNRFQNKMKASALIAMLAASLVGAQSYFGPAAAQAAEPSAAKTAQAAAPKTDLQLAIEKGAVEAGANGSGLQVDRPVTRAELVAIVGRAAKLPQSGKPGKPFPDVEDGQLQSVANAVYAGIVQGNELGRFEPQRVVTREELAAIVVRTVNKGREPKVNQNVLNYFKDAGSISGWARPYVAHAVLSGMFDPALDGTFNPQGGATREDVAKALKPVLFQLIDILTTNDIHGHIELDFDKRRNQAQGGMETLGGIVDDFRSVNPEGTIVVDGGDAWQGTLISNTTNGKSVIDTMGQIRYDAAAIGNHEFDFGRDALIDNIKQAPFPILGANIIDDRTGKRVDWAQPYALVDKNGLKVGIIGLATPQTKTTTKSTHIEGLTFADPVPFAKELSAELKAKGADIVMVTSHLPGEQDAKSSEIVGELVDLANGTGNGTLDAIVGGHSHRRVAGIVNGIPVVEAQNWLYAVGHIQLYVDKDTRKVVSSNAGLLETYTNLTTANASVRNIVADYQAKISDKTKQIIAEAGNKWSTKSFRYDVNGNQVRDGVTPIGNSVTDAMRAAEKSDIAFTNIGGLRTEIDQGKVTYSNMFEVLPFGNYNMTGTMTAEQIRKLMEVTDKYSNLPAIQFSGLLVEWDNTKPLGEKYSKITLVDGTPVYVDGKYNTDRTFQVTTNDFMATGTGDGFTVFGEVTDWKDGQIMLDAWVDYMKEQYASTGQPISLINDGREVRLDLK